LGNSSITSTTDVNKNNYPSDINVEYKKIIYNPATGREEPARTERYAGAIYYNKDGFDKNVRNYNEEWAG
jgi:hypothetical protein